MKENTMSTKKSALRFADRLGIRPLIDFSYRKFKNVNYYMAGDTYTIKAGTTTARFLIPTQNEFTDFQQIGERPIIEDLLAEIRPDDVFYDIGANTGLYSCLVADVVDQPVIAFEPHPENADRLEQNAELNGSDVTVYRHALSDTAGEAELSLTLDKVGSAGHSLMTNDDATGSITITMKCGDAFIDDNDLPEPSVLKIDVEGAEGNVLKGLSSTLSRTDCRLVYCEIHEDRLESAGYSKARLREILEGHGFTVNQKRIGDGEGETFLIGKK